MLSSAMLVAGESSVDPVGASTRPIQLLTQYLQVRGVDVAAILDGTSVDPSRLTDLEARVPFPVLYRVWERAEQVVGAPHLALHLVEALTRFFSPMFVQGHHHLLRLLLSSPTLGEGLRRLERYAPLVLGLGRYVLVPEAGGLAVRVVLPGTPCRSITEFFTCWYVMARAGLADPSITPRQVRFSHPREGALQADPAVFGTSLDFSATDNAMVFDQGQLAIPFMTSNPASLVALERQSDEILTRLLSPSTLAAQVRAVLEFEQRERPPTAEQTAALLGVSIRTLLRRLAEQGTSYQELVDDVRRERARRYLLEGASIATVAERLGFSGVSAFHRAFKRWFHLSPSDLKKDPSLCPPGWNR